MPHLVFINTALLVEKDDQGNITLPTRNSIKHLPHLQIIQDDNENFVAYIDTPNADNLNITTINIRQALCYFDHDLSNKIVYFLQLINYYSAHKFCGICGNPLVKQNNSKYLLCVYCNKEAYPKLAPCVIVRITRGDEILLARGPQFPPDIWALIAGFVDLGENLEQAIAREVMEEIGIKVENIRYWGSQSWPIPTSSLMIGFTADYKSGEIKVDNNEIEQAGFFTKDTIPGKPPTHFSIASSMIEEFLAH